VISIVTARSSAEADGIRDYSECLLQQLRDGDGLEVELVALEPDDVRRRRFRLVDSGPVNGALSHTDVCVIQYNPFCFGWWGFAPSLVVDVIRTRLSRNRPKIALFVHETYVPVTSWRWALMSAWQRVQLCLLRAASDIQICSIEEWAGRLRRMPPWTPVHHLPVSSNLPDARAHRDAARSELGVDEETIVIACFGLTHAGRLPGHAAAAADAVVAGGRRAYVLDFGTGTEQREVKGGLTVHSPGFLEAEPLARLLSAADIFLAPYADGVSTRRTTVMAALQHEIAVVATVGWLTDRLMREADGALELAPVDKPAEFAKRVQALAEDRERRKKVARAGRALYDEEFAWPVISRRLVHLLRERV
jgi:glycosyltransferase involved in cell wall biosynthesis